MLLGSPSGGPFYNEAAPIISPFQRVAGIEAAEIFALSLLHFWGDPQATQLTGGRKWNWKCADLNWEEAERKEKGVFPI